MPLSTLSEGQRKEYGRQAIGKTAREIQVMARVAKVHPSSIYDWRRKYFQGAEAPPARKVPEGGPGLSPSPKVAPSAIAALQQILQLLDVLPKVDQLRILEVVSILFNRDDAAWQLRRMRNEADPPRTVSHASTVEIAGVSVQALSAHTAAGAINGIDEKK